MKWFRRASVSAAALILFPSLAAQQHNVTFTITGRVASGIDVAGVFGPAGPIAAGRSFTLTFTFDDTKGESTPAACTGPPSRSRIDGSGEHSPGTAILQIGDSAPYRFDTGPGAGVTSWADRKLTSCCFEMAIGLKFGDSDHSDYVTSQLRGALTALTANSQCASHWSSAFPELLLSNDSTIAFMITSSRTGARAMGSLRPERVTGQGPPCTPPTSGGVHPPPAFHPQEQSNWCWAATTQMLAENATGAQSRSYLQCEQANAFSSKKNCCDRDLQGNFVNTDPNTCDNGQPLLKALSSLGFTCTSGGTGVLGYGTLSPEDMMRELSCKSRLIGFTWSQNNGQVFHDMVIYAYENTAKGLMLEVYDPQARVHRAQYTFPISYKDLMDPPHSNDPDIRRFDPLRQLCYQVRPK
jgi:hypothetical protein